MKAHSVESAAEAGAHEATLDDQLRAWFGALARQPVPPSLLRRVEELEREESAPPARRAEITGEA